MQYLYRTVKGKHWRHQLSPFNTEQMAGLDQNISQVIFQEVNRLKEIVCRSSEMIAVAVIVALWSLVLTFCWSKFTAAKKQTEDKCVDSVCVICLGEDDSLGDESRRVLPKCGHGFHTHCIETWLKINSMCPLCRSHVPIAISVRCTNNRFVSSLISAINNIWTWFLDPLSSGVIASLSNEECDFRWANSVSLQSEHC